MKNKTLQRNFRKQLINAYALTIMIISLFEIMCYAILIHSGVETFEINNSYLWLKVVFPIGFNLIAHIIARLILKSRKIHHNGKNATVIIAALATSFIVAILHKEYIVTCCAFVFPIILSATFNDRKLLNISFISSIIILVCVGFAFEFDGGYTLATSLNMLVLFGVAIVSFICGIISINFSEQSYSIIEAQSKKNQKLRENSLKDPMTKLYNHATFYDHLEKAMKNVDPGETLCLAAIDLDHFKEINDTYGHNCGDKVLIYAANTFKKYCGKQGVAYRFGGEEFTIIFKNITTEEVSSIINNILERFRKHKFDFSDSPITFSAGIAKYSDDITNSRRFFNLADDVLYIAKDSGRNQVRVSDAD